MIQATKTMRRLRLAFENADMFLVSSRMVQCGVSRSMVRDEAGLSLVERNIPNIAGLWHRLPI